MGSKQSYQRSTLLNKLFLLAEALNVDEFVFCFFLFSSWLKVNEGPAEAGNHISSLCLTLLWENYISPSGPPVIYLESLYDKRLTLLNRVHMFLHLSQSWPLLAEQADWFGSSSIMFPTFLLDQFPNGG